MFSPLLSSRKVRSPNKLLSSGTAGWVSGRAGAATRYMVRRERREVDKICLGVVCFSDAVIARRHVISPGLANMRHRNQPRGFLVQQIITEWPHMRLQLFAPA